MEITVREPNDNHYHWGVVFRGNCQSEEIWETPVDNAMNIAKANGWDPFHQGGYHLSHEACGEWHYLEFWALSGDMDHRKTVEEYIKAL